MTRADGFIGRTVEIARFERAVTDAQRGAPSGFVVIGEAGVGKSRLVREWTATARDAGALVLLGNCVQLHEVTVPYAPITEMMRGLVRERGVDEIRARLGAGCDAAAELLPDLADPTSAGQPGRADVWGQSRLFEAMFTMLG